MASWHRSEMPPPRMREILAVPYGNPGDGRELTIRNIANTIENHRPLSLLEYPLTPRQSTATKMGMSHFISEVLAL